MPFPLIPFLAGAAVGAAITYVLRPSEQPPRADDSQARGSVPEAPVGPPPETAEGSGETKPEGRK